MKHANSWCGVWIFTFHYSIYVVLLFSSRILALSLTVNGVDEFQFSLSHFFVVVVGISVGVHVLLICTNAFDINTDEAKNKTLVYFFSATNINDQQL